VPKRVPAIPGIEPGRLPFSPVVEANGLVFLAGQVGAPPGGEVVDGGIQAETRQVLDNAGRLLRAVGLDYSDVVRCTVFLVDMADFSAMNEVYREYFPTDMPVRATVGVNALAGPFRIEIDVTAAR
jgi:2-iminobutanoate/2-iminopropanoate deaminase